MLQMEEDCIDDSELQMVLATLAMYGSYSCNSLDSIYDGKSEKRAMKISVDFSRTFSLVFSVLASCGYPEPLNEVKNHVLTLYRDN